MIDLTYKGKKFSQRESDGFVNLGQLCSTHGKRFHNWSRLDSSKEYLDALAETLTQSGTQNLAPGTHIRVEDLLEYSTNFIGGSGGTWGHPLVAIEVARWISPDFGVWCNIHIKTLMETGTTTLVDSSEDKHISTNIQEIRDVVDLMRDTFGAPYSESLLLDIMQEHYPHYLLRLPSPRERTSFDSPSALLTPTQIAQELGLMCKNGKSASPQRANQLLQELGFQVKVSGEWSPTPMGEQFAVRKPVSTNSKTDRDQLLWKDSILSVLEEHSLR